MAKAYDRVRNADQRSEAFIRTPYWTPEIETDFTAWLAELPTDPMDVRITRHLDAGVSVSWKRFGDSVCCTLANLAGKDAEIPYLLTGWSDDAGDALAVAEFKLVVLLDGVWEEKEGPKRSRRH